MTSQGKRRASVLDVAKLAGVSVGTVSNVLNRPEAVAAATKDRVEAAIAELSFVPNGRARSLRAGKVMTVGVVVLDIRNPFFTEVARGIEDRLGRDGYTLMLANSDGDPDRERRSLRMFEEHGVAGVIVTTGSAGLGPIEAMHGRGVRVVLLETPSSIDGVPSVSVDNELGGALAVAHLLELGHRRIVFLNGPHAIRQCAERLRGARRAVTEAGLEPDEVLHEVCVDSLDAAGGDVAMRRLVEQGGGVPPAALFCVNDLVAIGVQRSLRRLGGHRLLREVAVVGYDDLDISAELAVPLTSVRQPALEMGRRAAELLTASDEEGALEGSAQHVSFQPELVVRASSTGA